VRRPSRPGLAPPSTPGRAEAVWYTRTFGPSRVAGVPVVTGSRAPVAAALAPPFSRMRITIAHSPDSDDAFMFYGLASGKVPAGDLEIVHVLSDIETLNRAAFEGRYEISAISFHAYAHLSDRYVLLPHGASMGDRYGPVVVAREAVDPALKGVRVAIPGTLTTAFLALRLYDPDVDYEVMPFDEIQEAVHAGRVQAGLLIHEGQLTYADEGLHKVVDLGEWWADRTGGLPLPLGGNVIRRDLGPELIARLSRLLHASIAYALEHRDEAVAHAMQYGRGLDRERTDRFVGMYVNQLTLDYGPRGRDAVHRLLGEASERGLIPPVRVEFAA
jgi:1,4-dihydroxy-6-naphthoate synthase